MTLDGDHLPPPLTRRQIDVLRAVCQHDRTTAAHLLGITPGAAGHHLTRVFRKIGLAAPRSLGLACYRLGRDEVRYIETGGPEE